MRDAFGHPIRFIWGSPPFGQWDLVPVQVEVEDPAGRTVYREQVFRSTFELSIPLPANPQAGRYTARVIWDTGPYQGVLTAEVPFQVEAGVIRGQVLLQGRGASEGVRVQALRDGSPVAEVWTDDQGRFSFSLAPGTYRIRASYPGFLREERTADVSSGDEVDLGTLLLRAGDLDGDGDVDLADLEAVAAALGQASTPADLNGDGRVDLLDLVLVALNFGRSVQ